MHAALTAAVFLAGSTALARAQDIDLFGDIGAPPSAIIPARLPAVSPPAGWAPEHAQAKPVAAALSEKAPDAVTRPAVPAPAKDPLDAAKPDATKIDATKIDAAKIDAAKTDAAKTDAAKPDAAKPDAAKPDAPKVADVAPLPPLNAAIKAALGKRPDARGAQAGERRKERAAIEAYYVAHAYAPAWSQGGAPTAAVEPLLARLAKAGDDALTIPKPPRQLAATGTPDEVAASDIALTEAVVAYARQATGARVDPRAISPLIGSRPALANPAEVIDALVGAGAEAGDRLEASNPRERRYVALRDKLVAMRGRAVATTQIPPGPTLKIGMHDGRVPLVRAHFGLTASDLVADVDEYDIEIAEAVSSFQRANGLPVSGQLNRMTVAALAVGGKASPQEAVIAANMEMWRWMPRDLGRDRIEVDVPAYKVTVFHDGEPVATNRVVVGKTDTPTPIFSNVMKYLIVNPVWNVPQSIIKNEMMPKMERNGGSLRGFDVSYRNGQMVVKQPSGGKNALGQIKFIFPNDFSVYLHDTPSKSLFSASKRAFSHGCVRVDQPFDFAFSVLNDGVPEGGKILWSEARLDKMIGDSERYVNLPKPLPIHIEYFTASVDPETGRIVRREDIYGYEHAVAAALAGEPRPAPLAKPAQVAEHKPHRTVAKTVVKTVAKTAVAADEDPR